MSTYTPIASQTTTGTTALISFTNVPQTYQDLVLVCQSKISTSFADIGLQFNNDTGANYADVLIVGYVSTAAGGTHNNANFLRGWYLSSSETYTMINLMDYRNTTNYKQVIGRSATVSANEIEVAAGSYRSTSPITTITLTPQAANFLANSTFNLYGIASGGGYALGGDIVTTDGTYWYHTFLSSGAFTPTKALTVDYLVVAGGAGGGDDNAGGGGAGGLRSTVTATGGGGSLETALSVTAQAYAVTVGAGGAGATINGNRGVNGSDSVFSTITSTGGGGGGGDTSGQRTGANGGSGGGGAGNSASVGGTGITGSQGYGGGTGSFTSPSVSIGGGGGGANAVGANASGTQAGVGGAGVATSITGSSVTYAGGGGGGAQNGTAGAGGAGGGGAGATSGTGTAGTANTGGGGGGGCTAGGNGGNGGSGIVIVRYAV